MIGLQLKYIGFLGLEHVYLCNNMRQHLFHWIFSAISRCSKEFFIKVMHFLANEAFHRNNSIFLRCFYFPGVKKKKKVSVW